MRVTCIALAAVHKTSGTCSTPPTQASFIVYWTLRGSRGQVLTFWIWEGGQGDGPLQAQAHGVPVEAAEHLQEFVEHLQGAKCCCSHQHRLQVMLLMMICSRKEPPRAAKVYRRSCRADWAGYPIGLSGDSLPVQQWLARSRKVQQLWARAYCQGGRVGTLSGVVTVLWYTMKM